MAIVWADGFDHWGSAAAALSGGYQQFDNNPTTGQKRTGAYSFQIYGWFRRVLDAGATKLGVCIGTYVNGAVGTDWLKIESAINTARVTLSFNADLSVTIKNNGVAVGTTPPNTYIVNTWEQWEIKVDMTGGVGTHTIELRKNGVAVNLLTINGLTITGPLTSVNVGQAALVGFYVDDFVIWDGTGANNNNWLGDRRCATVLPSANGAVQNWTPNTGTAWSNLNSVPAGANYITSSTAGDISEFSKSPIPVLTTSIAAVVIFGNCLKTDAGAAGYRLGMNKAGVVQNGPVINPGTTYSYGRYIMEVDPDGIAWTRATLDAASVRITRDV